MKFLDSKYVVVDTETTGFRSPIFIVEIAAQKMSGWTPIGPSFQILVDHGTEIPPESSRVHGYTAEILARDGAEPSDVYSKFAQYAEGLPLVSYNLAYDYDNVLMPELHRLGLKPIGTRGFCALRLGRRLLDPSPAGNCQLQTLRQYFRLPERGAHTALGDVMTVVDLFGGIFRPLAERRTLETWQDVSGFAHEEWFPSRISFGKFKGRFFREATSDPALMDWLVAMASSKNERNARLGRWYLRECKQQSSDMSGSHVLFTTGNGGSPNGASATHQAPYGLVLFVDPAVAELKRLIELVQIRLTEAEAEYTAVRAQINSMRRRLFRELRSWYKKRDCLRLLVDSREQYLATLLNSGDEEAEKVQGNHREARKEIDDEYRETAEDLEDKRDLSPEEVIELKSIYRSLMKLYHPDKRALSESENKTYHLLSAEINRAKNSGEIATLRRIACDPGAFIAQQGWKALGEPGPETQDGLAVRLQSLEADLVGCLDALNRLRSSNDFFLSQRIQKDPSAFDDAIAEQITLCKEEIDKLTDRADALEKEIVTATGGKGSKIRE